MKTPALLGFVSLALLAACSSPSKNDESLGDSVSQPIVGGQPATSYPEAALVDGPNFYCSGSVIAPKVVLTAGHCVVGTSSWTVRTPYSGNQTAHGSSGWTLYKSTGESVNPNTPDVALIFLDTPITLASYPGLASTKYANGTKGINVGRIQNNKLSTTQLFYGQAVTMNDATNDGFPYDYIASEIIESGDSGGPVYVGTGAGRVIAAVNSGAGGGTEVLARTDAVYTTIQSQIAAHGGGGGGTPDGGTPPPPPPADGGSSTSCTTNDDGASAYTSAHPLGSCAHGSLAAGGENWYAWNITGSSPYDLELTTTGDAEIQMWKTTNNGASWSKIANDTPTRFDKTSTGSGKYVVVVWSATGTPATYDLKLTK